jgi:putative resolvase
VNLAGWVHVQGIHVQTAYRWYREGRLPVRVRKAGRLILVSPQTAAEAARETEGAGLYARGSSRDHARVSSDEQESGLGGPVARLSSWAADAGLLVAGAEAGSGVNGLRVKVRRLLPDPVVTVMVAGHRDRPGRVNTELVEAALSVQGRRLVVLDNSEVTGGLAGDMAEVTSWCARLYGRRLARNRGLKVLGCAQQDVGLRAVKFQGCGGGV